MSSATCDWCGALYQERAKDVSRAGQRRFCSQPCQWKALTTGAKMTWLCGYCGKSFVAYRRKNGEARRFCSWNCSNTAHHRSASDMRGRIAFEYQLMDELSAGGWICQRTAGGRGPFDLIADNGYVHMRIQVKSTKNPLAESSIATYATAVAALRTWPSNSMVQCWLYVWVLMRGWIPLDIADLPIERPALKRSLRAAFRQSPLLVGAL